MATPSDIWATNAGAGLKDGTSLANAYALADAITAINGLGALTQPLTLRICGDCSVSAQLTITKNATKTIPIFAVGRNSTDTARQEVVIDAGGGAFSVFYLNPADYWFFFDIDAQNTNRLSGNHAWHAQSTVTDYQTWVRCIGRNANRGWMTAGVSEVAFIDCMADDNNQHGIKANASEMALRCVSRGSNLEAGFFNVRDSIYCLSYNNGKHGFESATHQLNCVAAKNTSDGYNSDNRSNCVDCISIGNGGYAYQGIGNSATLQRFAHYGDVTGSVVATSGAVVMEEDVIALSDDPFVDSDNGNFTLADNDAAAMLKSARFTFIDGSHKTYQDVGPLMHQAISRAAIADSVLDEPVASHGVSGSLGRVISEVKDSLVVTGPTITVTPGNDVDGVG